jgi:hypothetical protein
MQKQTRSSFIFCVPDLFNILYGAVDAVMDFFTFTEHTEISPLSR